MVLVLRYSFENRSTVFVYLYKSNCNSTCIHFDTLIIYVYAIRFYSAVITRWWGSDTV